MSIQALAITIIAGVLALASLGAITALLLGGVTVPAEFYALLGTSSGAAVLGGAVTQGAYTANKANGGS